MENTKYLSCKELENINDLIGVLSIKHLTITERFIIFYIMQNVILYNPTWKMVVEILSGFVLFIGVICLMMVMLAAIPGVFYKPKILSENEYDELLEVITTELQQIQVQLTFNQKLASKDIMMITTNLKTIEYQIELFEIKNEEIDTLLSAIHEKFIHNEVKE